MPGANAPVTEISDEDLLKFLEKLAALPEKAVPDKAGKIPCQLIKKKNKTGWEPACGGSCGAKEQKEECHLTTGIFKKLIFARCECKKETKKK